MKEKIKKVKNKLIKIFRNPVIAILMILTLLGLWGIGTFLFVNHVSFSVLTSQHNADFKREKILKNVILKGEFISNENNLGIIIIPFERYVKPDFEKEDQLRFRLKEKDSENWHYDSLYRSGSVDGEYFPIGFPQIANSKNKIYEFELVSLNGNSKNALTPSKNQFISGYQFSKQEIFSNNNSMSIFFIKKISYSSSDIYLILNSVTYLLPLIIYLLFLIGGIKSKRLALFIKIIFSILLIVNLFIVKEAFYGLMGLCLILWLWLAIKNKYTSMKIFKLAFTIIFIWLIIKFVNINYPQENFNILSYGFLVIGVIQALIEERKNGKI